MFEQGYYHLKVNEELERYFDDASLPGTGDPVLVVLLGAVAVGKTTIRKRDYSSGFVVVDAAEVFLNLCRGERPMRRRSRP
jgi:hypothetical protein